MHLNDLGISFRFSRLIMDLLSALSVEPNEVLLSLYCPFHLNLPLDPTSQTAQFRVLWAKLLVFLQALQMLVPLSEGESLGEE